jgi:hypothetical protein
MIAAIGAGLLCEGKSTKTADPECHDNDSSGGCGLIVTKMRRRSVGSLSYLLNASFVGARQWRFARAGYQASAF